MVEEAAIKVGSSKALLPSGGAEELSEDLDLT
jgi:hypothetical protein